MSFPKEIKVYPRIDVLEGQMICYRDKTGKIVFTKPEYENDPIFRSHLRFLNS